MAITKGRSPNQDYLDAERDRAREAEIAEWRTQGHSQKVIGEHFGISASRVGQILKRLRREAERT